MCNLQLLNVRIKKRGYEFIGNISKSKEWGHVEDIN